MKKSRVHLSQCMIVKNEEENIENALSWGKGIVYEQIVVDTGSTDQTVELAKKMGAKVFHYEWDDNFAAAKNYAISKARGNWVALLDADEWFPEEDAKRLLPVLEKIHPDRRIDFLRTKWVHLKKDGSVLGASCQDRVFRNDPKLRYRYRIHEELHRRGKAKPIFEDLQDSLMILHTGYADGQIGIKKGERNARLLELDLQENPRDAMRLMYLADSYRAMNEESKALECYRKVLNDPEMVITHRIAPLRAGLQIMEIRITEPLVEIEDEYVQISQKLREMGYGNHPDIDYFLGYWHLGAGNVKKAGELFETALKKAETYHGEEVVRMTNNMELPNRIVATAALMENDPKKAVQYAISALNVNKYSADGLQLLIKAFLTEWREGMSAEPYWQFLCKLYDAKNLKDLLFLHRCTEEMHFTDLKERVWEAIPLEVQEQMKKQQVQLDAESGIADSEWRKEGNQKELGIPKISMQIGDENRTQLDAQVQTVYK